MRSGRVPELDALRGVAVLMVMLYHYGSRYGGLYGHAGSVPFETEWGYYGVHVFFMISGCVIPLTAGRAASAGAFLANRVVRLYPAFWVACAITLGVVGVFGLPGRELTLLEALPNVTMFPSQLGGRMIDGVYWTLRVEWVFYALVAAMVALGRCGLIALVLTVLVGVDALGLGVGKFFSCFLVGVCAYETAGRRPAQCGLHAAALALCLRDLARHNPPEIVAMLAGFGVLIFVLARRPLPWLANPVLVFTGTISYGLYLLHQNIGYVAMRECYERGATMPVAIGVALAVVTALAAGLTFAVERPVLKWWRDRRARVG